MFQHNALIEIYVFFTNSPFDFNLKIGSKANVGNCIHSSTLYMVTVKHILHTLALALALALAHTHTHALSLLLTYTYIHMKIESLLFVSHMLFKFVMSWLKLNSVSVRFQTT